jgi:hypothetical protein
MLAASGLQARNRPFRPGKNAREARRGDMALKRLRLNLFGRRELQLI